MTTPLEQIRRAELSAARRIDQAKLDAEQFLEEARARVRTLVARAGEAGDREADNRYETAISRAKLEARQIEDQFAERAEILQRKVAPEIDHLAAAMLELVLAPPEERGV